MVDGLHIMRAEHCSVVGGKIKCGVAFVRARVKARLQLRYDTATIRGRREIATSDVLRQPSTK
jgi:hypothetical protein